jgi:hypothetical protein
MSIEHEVDEILDGFVEITNEHPRAQAFGEAVAEHIAARPSPTVDLIEDGTVSLLERISAQLDTVIALLRGGGS